MTIRRSRCTDLGQLLVASLLFAAPGLARAAGGTITGKVDVTPPKYTEETVVYLKQVAGQYPHKTATMDQKGMRFLPHVLAITVGDTVNFANHDAVAHNVFSPEGGYNLGTFGPNESRTHVFAKTGTFTQLCSIHPEMLAFIFVGQNPYSATVDKAGTYTITDVPPGTYQIAVWNSHGKAADQSVTVAEGKTVKVNFLVRK